MNGELVATTTTDHVRLNGFLISPRPSSPDISAGAVIMHGLAGNFYSSPLLLNLAVRLATLGIHSLVGNSRGHDVLNWSIRSGRSQTLGAAVEDVAESPHDLLAWSKFLQRHGCKRVLYLGHSLGAIKVLYTLSRQLDEHVRAAIALSPTRLNFEQFTRSRSGGVFLKTYNEAKQFVESGTPQQLMRIQFPFPTWMTAEAYVAKYGPENRFDWFRFAEDVRVPTLALFGELELRDNLAFEGLREDLEGKFANHRCVEVRVIPEADHFYVACIESVSIVVADWFEQQLRQP